MRILWERDMLQTCGLVLRGFYSEPELRIMMYRCTDKLELMRMWIEQQIATYQLMI